MIRNKALFERFLVLFACLSFMLSMLGFLPDSFRYGYKIEARAVDQAVTTLTVEQTLALYGRQLNALYYNNDNGRTYSINFNYAFTMKNWVPSDSAAYSYFTAAVYGSNDQATALRNDLLHQNFLVYLAPISYDNNSAPWVSSDTNNHANVYLNFSVDFSLLSSWDQYFMWSYDPVQSGGDYSHSYLSDTYDNGTRKSYALRRQTSQVSLAYTIFPMYKMAHTTDIPDEDQLGYSALIHRAWGPSQSTFSLYRQELSLNSVYPFDFLYNNVHGGSYVFLFIGCPSFTGSNNQVTTTAVSGTHIGTTASVQSFPTVDLSGLESGVATMVQQQDEGNYYERVQIDQLNMIIEQLNSIYAEMVQRGEVPISLTDADSYPTLNSTVLSGVNDAITTYTMAQLPSSEIGNGATGLNAFMFFLGDGPWMAIGLFCVSFSIFCWFIFRGRSG